MREMREEIAVQLSGLDMSMDVATLDEARSEVFRTSPELIFLHESRAEVGHSAVEIAAGTAFSQGSVMLSPADAEKAERIRPKHLVVTIQEDPRRILSAMEQRCPFGGFRIFSLKKV